jgi:hypothetical protein
MPYILNKTNGSVLATLQDASVDLTTNLTFVGRNYSGYGEIFNENFVKLLENFSNSTKPTKPLQGQLWFDSTAENRRLNVCYDGKNFKGIASIRVQSNTPDSSVKGDLWWDSANNQLKAFDGAGYQIVGPATSSASRSKWAFDEEIGTNAPTNTSYSIIKGLIGSDPIVTIAGLGSALDPATRLDPKNTSDLYDNFRNGVRKGITLAGCDANGSSTSSEYYFWGTAVESLRAITATNVTLSNSSANAEFYVNFVSTATGSQRVYTTSTFHFNPSSNLLTVTASQSKYADLAERYHADAEYDVGTVLVIGGDAEVTISTQRSDTRIAGIVSVNPAYRMNSEAGNDKTHPFIALKGRVPCKVAGRICKGDMLITSETPGHARAYLEGADNPNAIFARALEDFPGGYGEIEVKV